MEQMCDPKRQVRVKPAGRMYLRMLRGTHQPCFQSDMSRMGSSTTTTPILRYDSMVSSVTSIGDWIDDAADED